MLLYCMVAYFVRRIVFAGSAILLKEFPWFQLFIQINSSLLIIAVKLRYMPYQDKIGNILDIYNELTLLAVSILLYPYCDFINNPGTQYNLGWAIVFLTLLFISINMISFLTEMIQ